MASFARGLTVCVVLLFALGAARPCAAQEAAPRRISSSPGWTGIGVGAGLVATAGIVLAGGLLLGSPMGPPCNTPEGCAREEREEKRTVWGVSGAAIGLGAIGVGLSIWGMVFLYQRSEKLRSARFAGLGVSPDPRAPRVDVRLRF